MLWERETEACGNVTHGGITSGRKMEEQMDVRTAKYRNRMYNRGEHGMGHVFWAYLIAPGLCSRTIKH
jgi:hypothetical protein